MHPITTIRMNKILLHACCGPCATHCVLALRNAGWDPTLFFANDNMDSAEEFEKRLESLRLFAHAQNVPVEVAPYEPESWNADISGFESAPEGGARCARCFLHNLSRTAAFAVDRGFHHFTTSLTVSPHKHSPTVFAAGNAAAAAADDALAFEPFNFKKQNGFQHSVSLAKEYGLYRQDYCGCRFSRQLARNRDSLPSQPS